MGKRLFTKRIHKNYLIYFFQQIFILKLLFDIILVSNLRYLKLCYLLLTDDLSQKWYCLSILFTKIWFICNFLETWPLFVVLPISGVFELWDAITLMNNLSIHCELFCYLVLQSNYQIDDIFWCIWYVTYVQNLKWPDFWI